MILVFDSRPKCQCIHRRTQKDTEGHRSVICDTAGCGTDLSVDLLRVSVDVFWIAPRSASGLAKADPLNAYARGVLGGKYLIAVSARTVCARRIDSRLLSCRRCQEPPSTTCRALDRRRLGGSRHRRRNDSSPRRVSSTLAESRRSTCRSRWPGGTGLRHIPCGNDYNPAQSSTGRDRDRSAAFRQMTRTIAQAMPAS